MAHWTGLKLKNLEITDSLGEGAFARVYKATGSDGKEKALKVAGTGFGDNAAETGFFQSRALQQISSGFADFKVSGQELLQKQYDRLKEFAASGLFVRVESFENLTETSWILMEYLSGKSLRRQMLDGEGSFNGFGLALLRLLAEFEKKLPGAKHGDLKPENLVFSGNGRLVMIDPGYYGSLLGKDGRQHYVRVTTPAYYPGLDADDMFAAGLILFELATGEQLLTAHLDRAAVGAKLEARLHGLECTGNHFFSGLRAARSPASFKPMSDSLSNVIAKSLGLAFDRNGREPELADRFNSFGELYLAMKSVLS